MLSIRGPKNFAAGLIFLALAALFGWSGMSLDLGTARRMGPGYFPMMLVGLLVLFGLIILVDGLVRRDDAPDRANYRGIVLVLGAVIAFAYSIESLGLILAVAITSFLMSLAGKEFRLLPAIATAGVLAFFSWLVFVKMLSLPWQPFGYLLR